MKRENTIFVTPQQKHQILMLTHILNDDIKHNDSIQANWIKWTLFETCILRWSLLYRFKTSRPADGEYFAQLKLANILILGKHVSAWAN